MWGSGSAWMGLLPLAESGDKSHFRTAIPIRAAGGFRFLPPEERVEARPESAFTDVEIPFDRMNGTMRETERLSAGRYDEPVSSAKQALACARPAAKTDGSCPMPIRR